MTTLRDLVLRVEAADVTEAIARLYDRGEKTKVMFEYILIAGVNDTDEQARELAKIARRLSAKAFSLTVNGATGVSDMAGYAAR